MKRSYGIGYIMVTCPMEIEVEEKLGHRPHNGHLPDGQSSSSLLRTPSTMSSTSATSTKAGRVPWLRYVNSALALSSSFLLLHSRNWNNPAQS